MVPERYRQVEAWILFCASTGLMPRVSDIHQPLSLALMVDLLFEIAQGHYVPDDCDKARAALESDGGLALARVQERLPFAEAWAEVRPNFVRTPTGGLDHPALRRVMAELGWVKGPRLHK